MKKGTKECLRIIRDIGGIISPFVSTISIVFDAIDVTDKFIIYIRPIIIISTLFTLGYAIYYVFNIRKMYEKDKRIEEQEEIIGLLEKNISNGMKNYKNVATVTFDLKDKKYHLEIKKEYEIISDGIKWYEGQFYSNKILESATMSQEFYSNNQISWEDLDIRAQLSYKNIGEEDYSPVYELAVLKAAEGNNYKQFHIQYITKKENDSLDIRKGAYIKLKYDYSVPIFLWGSYLNRYITFWNEEAEVYFKCQCEEKLNIQNFKLFRADDLSGEPRRIQIKECRSDRRDTLYYYKIVLPRQRFTKFIVWWDANKIFDKDSLNTNLTADRSQLTQY